MATYTANHPISGQLYTFTKKSDAEHYADEVQAATGYRPQLFPVGPEVEPTTTLESGAVTIEGPGAGPVDPATVAVASNV